MRYDTGGDLLVAVLRELGIDTVFGIVSVHNLPLVEAVDRELRFVPVRHEASAVNAADAYGRARGTLGCALTSTGTGAGNAAGSLIEALASGTSVLHITGQVESEFLGSGADPRGGGPQPARGGPRRAHRAGRPRERGVAGRPPVRGPDRHRRGGVHGGFRARAR
jgi:hypothetical protein